MTRVLHLVISLAPGGLERLVVDWANARNRQWPDSTRIVCLDEIGGLAEQVQGEGRVVCVHATRARWPFDIGAVWRLRKVMRGFMASCGGSIVLHSHNAAAWQYAALSCIGLKVRHIHTEHGTNPHYRGLFNRIRAAVVRRLTDGIVAVSNSTVEDLVSNHGIPRRDITVIANGVEVGGQKSEVGGQRSEVGGQRSEGGGQRSEVRALLGIPAEAMVIGSVGRLAEVKGYDRLIAAMATIHRQQTTDNRLQTTSRRDENDSSVDVARAKGEGSRYILLLVGDGPERMRLEGLAKELGIAEKVLFAGYQQDPKPYLRAMDVFVLPSRSEGLSVALLEAMAAGVPVWVTDVGENRVVIEGGRCGVVLPPDEKEWAEVLVKALGDREGIRMRVNAARQRVRDCYSLDATLAEYERVYRG